MSDIFTVPELDLLDRYFAGQCTADDVARAQTLLSRDAESAERLHLLREHVRASVSDAPDPARMWARLQDTISAPPADRPRFQRETRRTSLPLVSRDGSSAHRKAWGRNAAIGVVGALAITLAVIGSFSHRGSHSSETSAVGAERVYVTHAAQRATVRLADGTAVTLAPSTTLRVNIPAGEAGTRTVTLTGEAIFEVTPDSRRPFVVHAGMSVTRVLGTRFGIRHYDDDPDTRVLVASGRVSLNTVLLEAGDAGRLAGDGLATVTRNTDVAAQLAWATGRLAFRDATVADVAAQLSRWYDLTVVVTDPTLAARRVTFAIDADPSTASNAEVLGDILGARVERDGRVLKLFPRSHR